MLFPFLLPILISVTLWPPAQTSIWAKSPRGAWDYCTTEGFQINTLKATAYAQSHLINIADSICSGKWWEVMSLVLGKCILFMQFTILTAVCSEGQFCMVVSGPSLQPIEHGQQKRVFTLPRSSFSTPVVSSSCAKQQTNRFYVCLETPALMANFKPYCPALLPKRIGTTNPTQKQEPLGWSFSSTFALLSSHGRGAWTWPVLPQAGQRQGWYRKKALPYWWPSLKVFSGRRRSSESSTLIS